MILAIRSCKKNCAERSWIYRWRRTRKGLAAGVAIFTPVRGRTDILISFRFGNANSICHARMTLSGIHYSDRLQSGFPIRIDSGMAICESIKIGHTIFFSRLLRAVLLIPRSEAAAPWFPFDSLRASLTRNASASLRVGNLADS